MMTVLPAGIVLPADILIQPWFSVFTLFVALNTIVYLGLTAAKFVPWPAPVHPNAVRSIVNPTEEVSQMQQSFRSALKELDNPAQDLRDATARQTIPIALALVGALMCVIGLLYLLLYFDSSGPVLLIGPILGFILIVLSLLLARSRASAEAMRWTWAILMVGFIAENCWRAVLLDSAVPLAYGLITLGFTAAITLSWGAGIFSAILGAVPIVIGGYLVSIVDTVSWALASAAAALASLVVLYLRLASLDRVAEERARADALATTDPVTGLFSRHGLIALASSLADATVQSDHEISVIACELPDLTELNASYGFEYGAEVLSATGRALRASLPRRALISRWSANTFLALITGEPPEVSQVQASVDERLAYSGVALGKVPIRVRVGSATGSPATTSLEVLVAEAEAQTHAS